MDEHRRIAEDIVKTEWDFFQKVQNEGGRAGCQDDWQTFRIMRTSQYLAWNDELLASWQKDLEEAAAEGRNPVAEKYAWMMKYTAPEEFEKLKSRLPAVPEHQEVMIDEAAACQVEWRLAFQERYPRLAGRGRPVRTAEDRPWDVSLETYFRGEALTWSERTLALYLDWVRALKAEGRNLIEETMEYTVRFYGYGSLDEVM